MDKYYHAIRALPAWLAHPLERLPPGLAGQIHELRFRTGCGICLTVRGQQRPLSSFSECPSALCRVTLTSLQLEEILFTLCGGSIHTHQNELSQGFLTTSQGCRVGVAGRFIQRNGLPVLQQVTSLNLRIARVVPIPLPEKLRAKLKEHFVGMLIVGEPDSGKTTLLRQIAIELAEMQRGAAVVDERGELFPLEKGVSFPALDVLAGVPKEAALQMALRTLSPQVILLDELGSLRETAALEQDFFSGVDFVASVHASGAEDAFRRPQVQFLQKHGMLRIAAVLEGRNSPGKIREVTEF